MKKITYLLAISLFCMKALAQNVGKEVKSDTVSLAKMIQNFKVKKHTSPIDHYDAIEGINETNTARLTTSPLPTQLPGINTQNYHAVWKGRYSQLILKKILPIGISQQEADRLFESLAKKYGGNREEGIFASWFTGTLTVLECPYNLFGEGVSRDKLVLTVKKGYITSSARSDFPLGTLYNCKKELFFYDGCWEQNLSEIPCLAAFINRQYDSVFSFGEKHYSLLLFTDLSGKSYICTLEPENLGWIDRRVIEKLKNAIALLPQGSFGYMETLGGKIFQGRYLKATYSYRKGWKLQDYIH